jgi:hypothetical protein
VTAAVIAGLAVAFIAAIARYGWTMFKKSRGRSHLTITLMLSTELSESQFVYFLFRVREGPDTAPLINRAQRFTMASRSRLDARVAYPLAAGLQFKCFADWTGDQPPPSLPEVRELFESNGWQEVSIDGLNPGRFWFILPNYATKDTEDVNRYRNNWRPAGPRAA